MKKSTKRLFAVLLVLTMVVGLLPTIAFAETIGGEADPSKPVYIYTEEDNALIENDVFAKIETVKAEAAQKMGGIEKMTEQDYVKLVPQVIKQIESSETYKPGTLQQNGYFLVWETTVGIPCCYDPRMEAQLHNNADAPSPEEAARIEAEAEAMVQHYETRGGTPTSPKIGLIQPYWESSSSYDDSSFLNYSPKYKTTWQNLYGATGGSGIRYSMSNANVNNIASTMEQCGLVIFDSHGTTDYTGSNEDYTSRANSSYLCLITNTGVTSTDTAAHTGTYGTYYDALKGSGYAYVNGQCIANHMSSNAPHSMLYMGICLGMATDRMCAPLRAKGVEIVYGYSQSVTFTGELKSIQSIMPYIQNDMQAGAAIEQSQTDLGCQWDPAYPNYTETQARNNKVAFPVVASTEDTYPGHGNVDRVLTAYSTWHLFGDTYTVTATSNNTNYGTVSVDGYVITASPKTGYYAQGYTVTSGTATVTQNGNTFTVDPSSDCTVRINFAAKTAATVTYLANGTSVGTASGYVGDQITLRTTATAFDGWTFKGWVENTVAETSTKPSFYNPGAAYTIPAASTTLHALYTRFEEGTGDTVYQLVDSLEDGGKYIIVSQEGISGSTGYAVGNTIVTSNHYLTAVSVTISGEVASASSSNLAKVVWQAASSGSKWTFYNQAVGKYMALDSSEYLYPSSTALAWALTSEGYLDNEVDTEGYYYLSYDATNGRYTTSKQGKAINFYAETAAGTTYYSTSPVTVAHEHTMQSVPAVAPTCTAAGNIAYYRCSSCGKYYSDANGNNEITQASTVLAALGHNYVATVTPPTETTQGYTTHTCSRCGDTYVDTYVPALGSDFTVHFSVPDGVTKPADMVSNTNTGITLPTVTGPEGYTFLGWVVADYDNVDTRPAQILTGNYIAPQEITLKALFSYLGEGTGEIAYQLAEAPEAGGEYVIVADESISGTTGYAVGNTAITSGHYLTPVAVTINSNDTCTVTNPATVLWKAAASGSGFTFYNEAVGKYMALDSSEFLAPMDSGIAWVYNSNKYLDNQIDSEGYYYLSYSTASTSINYTRYTTGKITTSSTSNYVIHLYQKVTLGTTYYTTIIGAPHEHTPAAAVVENQVAATCTAAGSYDNVVYCTECGEELSRETVTVAALGHDFSVLVEEIEPTCTDTGLIEYKCSRCDETVLEESEALGHLPGEAVEENYVAPTATVEGGYDTVVYCQRCGQELSREHTILDPTGPVEPIETSALRIFSSISVGTDMVVTWSARKADVGSYAKFWIEVVKHAPAGDETYLYGADQEAVLTEGNTTWSCDFKHIFAKEMGLDIEARVYAEDASGQIWMSPAKTTNIRDYLGGRLTAANNSAEQRTLAADMLNYGAAAQLYMDYNTAHLVNEELTAEQLAKLDEYETKDLPVVEKNNSNFRPEGQSNILFNSVSLDNEVILSLTIRAAEGSDVKVLMKDHETGTVLETLDTAWNGSYYVVNYSGIGADKMRMAYDIVAQINGAETGNIRTWSVEGYVGELRSGSNQLQINVANALLTYGDAAAAYFSAQ